MEQTESWRGKKQTTTQHVTLWGLPSISQIVRKLTHREAKKQKKDLVCRCMRLCGCVRVLDCLLDLGFLEFVLPRWEGVVGGGEVVTSTNNNNKISIHRYNNNNYYPHQVPRQRELSFEKMRVWVEEAKE